MAQEKQAEKKAQRFFEPKCSPVVGIYQWEVDEDGHHLFKKKGEKNFDDEIQRWKDQTDIKVIIDKLKNGDADTVARLSQPGVYADVNNFPKEVHPAAMDDALNQFYENQPDAIKQKYPRYEDFKKYFLNLTDAMISKMAEDEAAVKAAAEKEKTDREAAAAQAQLDAQAAAFAKAMKGVNNE